MQLPQHSTTSPPPTNKRISNRRPPPPDFAAGAVGVVAAGAAARPVVRVVPAGFVVVVVVRAAGRHGRLLPWGHGQRRKPGDGRPRAAIRPLAAGYLGASFPTLAIISSAALMTVATCSSVGPAAGNIHRSFTRSRL